MLADVLFKERKEFKFKRLYKFLNIQAPAENFHENLQKVFHEKFFLKI